MKELTTHAQMDLELLWTCCVLPRLSLCDRQYLLSYPMPFHHCV